MRIFDIILFIGLIILIFFGVYIIIYQGAEEHECRINPLIYSVKHYKNIANLELTCKCNFDDIFYIPFVLNTTGINYLDSEMHKYKFNMTKVNEIIIK